MNEDIKDISVNTNEKSVSNQDDSKQHQCKNVFFSPIPTNNTPNTSFAQKDLKKFQTQSKIQRLPSNDSLNFNLSPTSSPGINYEILKMDTSLDKETKLSRKESYKAQRKHYRKEKKRVVNEVATSLKDPSVVILADWLKVRGTLKSWTKLWCILKPGLLLIYKSPKIKSNHWVGTVLLNCCQVIERPSKKDGFCFKLFHPLDQSIWAPKGPEKETIGAVVQPLPTSYLIFRAPSQAAGKCWMDALELALRSSTVLVRSMSNKSGCSSTNHETQWSEVDYEKHFNDTDLNDGNHTDNGGVIENISNTSESESDVSVKEVTLNVTNAYEDIEKLPETEYILSQEDFNMVSGAESQELPEDQRSLIVFLIKQVRPGMDLSKVVLPTFILEPRSFLDKLSDAYYHADILSNAVVEDDPFNRMKQVVKWYLSGFYKKPKGLKKPYNPILGETFRCYWKHPNGSKTFYIAEQVCHHPPISAFYVTNRQDGFSISCSILAKSKFYGNSTSAILDGIATLTLLPRGEEYSMSLPYAHCKGILMGTLSMELGGKVHIDCEKTNYSTEIDFKIKSFLRRSSDINQISGRINLGKETLATIEGYWDGKIVFKDRRTGTEEILWNSSEEVHNRLKRFIVPLEQQNDFESEKLWLNVSNAIAREDQVAATEEKTILEEAQRNAARERQLRGLEWEAKYFKRDDFKEGWVYKAADLRPWDPRNDVYQYENEYNILTKTRHPTPIIRTSSIISVEPHLSCSMVKPPPRRQKLAKQSKSLSSELRESISSSAEECHSDTSQERCERMGKFSSTVELKKITELLQNINENVNQQKDQIRYLKQSIDNKIRKSSDSWDSWFNIRINDIFVLIIGIIIYEIFQLIITYFSSNYQHNH